MDGDYLMPITFKFTADVFFFGMCASPLACVWSLDHNALQRARACRSAFESSYSRIRATYTELLFKGHTMGGSPMRISAIGRTLSSNV